MKVSLESKNFDLGSSRLQLSWIPKIVCVRACVRVRNFRLKYASQFCFSYSYLFVVLKDTLFAQKKFFLLIGPCLRGLFGPFLGLFQPISCNFWEDCLDSQTHFNPVCLRFWHYQKYFQRYNFLFCSILNFWPRGAPQRQPQGPKQPISCAFWADCLDSQTHLNPVCLCFWH